MRPRSRRIAALTLVSAFLAACSDTSPTAVQAPTTGPHFQISDAGNSAGLPGFYFLPPMVPDPGRFTGTFDANLSPEVRVCQLAGSVCGATIKTFTLTTPEPVEISVQKGTYGVNWGTKNNPSSLTTNVKYRVEVRVGTRLLGFADLAFVAASKDLAGIAPGTVGSVLGSPVNIKFRIETGIVGSVIVTPPTASITLPGDQTFSAEVRDLHGVVMSNASVTWASANTAAATVSPASGGSTTATGVAAGTAVITATTGGFTGSADLTVMRRPNAEDDSYSGTAGELLSSGAAPAIATLLANDDAGSPNGTIASVTVDGTTTALPLQTAIAFAGGTLQVSVDGNFSVSTEQAGQYSFSYTLTNAVGSDAATVTVAIGVGAPAAMTALSSLNQKATAGTAVAEPPSVRITDQWSNPVAGVAVTFVALPVGSVTGSPATTDGNGVATAGSWTLGTSTANLAERSQIVTATAGSLTKQFTAKAVAGAPVSLTLTPPTTSILGGDDREFSAIARDIYGNAIFTKPVIRWQSSSGAATVSPVESQSSGFSAAATTTLTTIVLPADHEIEIDASLKDSPSISASLRLTVISGMPLAKDDLFEVTQICTASFPGLGCVLSNMKVDGNVLADNGEGPDFLGPPGVQPAHVTGFAFHESGPWHQAGVGDITFTGDLIESINIKVDGTLEYVRSGPVPLQTSYRLWYRLQNNFGTVVGSVVIRRNPANP